MDQNQNQTQYTVPPTTQMPSPSPERIHKSQIIIGGLVLAVAVFAIVAWQFFINPNQTTYMNNNQNQEALQAELASNLKKIGRALNETDWKVASQLIDSEDLRAAMVAIPAEELNSEKGKKMFAALLLGLPGTVLSVMDFSNVHFLKIEHEGDLAAYYMYYESFFNGQLASVGAYMFVFHKQDETWVLIYDTNATQSAQTGTDSKQVAEFMITKDSNRFKFTAADYLDWTKK